MYFRAYPSACISVKVKTKAHAFYFVNNGDIGMLSCFQVVEGTFEITSSDD